MIGETARTGRDDSCIFNTWYRQDRINADPGIGRAQDHQVGGVQRIQHARSRVRLFRTLKTETGDFRLALAVDKIFLEGHLPVISIHPGGDDIIAGWQNCIGDAPGAAKITRHLAQLLTRPQAARALQMGAQVAIAQAEPGWPAQGREAF